MPTVFILHRDLLDEDTCRLGQPNSSLAAHADSLPRPGGEGVGCLQRDNCLAVAIHWLQLEQPSLWEVRSHNMLANVFVLIVFVRFACRVKPEPGSLLLFVPTNWFSHWHRRLFHTSCTSSTTSNSSPCPPGHRWEVIRLALILLIFLVSFLVVFVHRVAWREDGDVRDNLYSCSSAILRKL